MSDDATTTTEEEDEVYKVLCGNLLHHLEGPPVQEVPPTTNPTTTQKTHARSSCGRAINKEICSQTFTKYCGLDPGLE